MAIYPKAVQKLIPPDSTDPRIDANLAVLHIDSGNASSLYNWWIQNGTLECHFFVKKDGTVEQYVDTKYQADAQVGGASHAISIETQGYEAGEWTAPQLAAIKALLLWLHEAEGVPLKVPTTPYDSGVGYHSMWPSSREGTWARDGRTCPGPDRVKQYRTDIVPWMGDPTPAVPEEDDMPTPRDLWAYEYKGRQALSYLVTADTNARAARADAGAALAIAKEQAAAGRPLTADEITAAAKAGAAAALDEKIADATTTTVLEVKP